MLLGDFSGNNFHPFIAPSRSPQPLQRGVKAIGGSATDSALLSGANWALLSNGTMSRSMGHWSADAIQCGMGLKVELLKVPPKAASVCQPADTTWNGPMKCRLRAKWVNPLREQLLARDVTIPFKRKPSARSMICICVSSAWNEIPASIIAGVSGIVRNQHFFKHDIHLSLV
ncbi:hypothetical protein GN244_ATG01579 [Phytophthora infestans]|uniref:DDE-1 domain-containing protein n=1 Tax=Phytophthora infestans TaxID=4787 RepID=A0A833TFW6_PHYIN|nr:hypothetical protein GN244_ATG01579 [Phytophthora infestans]